MRVTVGGKVFGIAGSMLALMLAVSLVTVWKTRSVNAEVANIADRLVPITHRVSAMGSGTQQQKLLLERLFRRLESPDGDPAEVDRLVAEFDAVERRFDALLREALDLAAAGVAAAPEEDDRIEFSRIELGLGAIDRQHQDYYDLAHHVVRLEREGRSEAAGELARLLAQEQDEYDRAVERAVIGLQGFTERSSTEAEVHSGLLTQFIVGIALFAAVLGLAYAALLTRGLVKPLGELLRGTQAVEAGRLDTGIRVTSADEIGELSRAFNRMVEGLRVKEQIKDTFGKYVDPRVVEGLIGGADSRAVIAPDGEKRAVTVFFSDIAGFTTIGERLTPQGLVRLINGYLTLASQPIVERSGIIDKYIGDAVMAFWGPPFVHAGQEGRLAALAALDSFTMLERFRAELPDLMGLRSGLPEIDIRVGLASGDAVVGNIGSEVARSYTVMGDTVNLGSRLEGVNKVYGTRILMCGRTRELAGDAVEAREIDTIAVKGKHEAVRIFELLGRAGELSPDRIEARDAYERGLAAYRDGAFDAATLAFEQCRAARPDDRPAAVFLSRLAGLRQAPPEHDWDGVWRLARK